MKEKTTSREEKVEGRDKVTRAETRCGCFLPDLTRLARCSSTNRPSGVAYRLFEAKMQGFEANQLRNHWNMAFEMDTRLAADTLPVARLELCQLRLMNDRRWPWLILVPAVAGASEIHLLSVDEQALLAYETGVCAQTLQKVTGCLKINSGALGNVIRQLHVHVIARNEGDANWPGPVWGYGARIPFELDQAEAFIQTFRRAYPATLS